MKKQIKLKQDFESFIMGKRLSMQDTFVVLLQGKRMNNPWDLYHELEAVLQFPSYFGGNWDAVYDCITDFEWLKEKKYLIGIMDFDQILNNFDGDKNKELEIFISVLKDAIKYWHTPDNPDEWFGHIYRDFDVFIQDKNEVYQLLPDN